MDLIEMFVFASETGILVFDSPFVIVDANHEQSQSKTIRSFLPSSWVSGTRRFILFIFLRKSLRQLV
jgi:hypothetical protein